MFQFFNKFFRSSYFRYVYLIVLVLITTFISVRFLLPESLRLDESQSIWQSNHPYLEMLQWLARDVHMPLYATMLHYWMQVFGNDIYSNRILSLLFHLMSIPMVFALTLSITKKQKIGLFVATMFTVSPFLNWFGSELRMYSLFTFLSLVSSYFFVKIIDSKQVNRLTWIGYGITTILGVYTHYLFSVFVFCQFLFLLFNRQILDRQNWIRFLVVLFSAFLTFLPWLSYVIYINSAGSQAPLLAKPSTVDLFNVYSNHIFGFQDDFWNTIILSFWPLIGLVGLYFLQKKSIVIKPKYTYLILMTFLPTAILFVVSTLITSVFLSRYLIMALPPLFVLIASLLYSQQTRILQFLRVFIIIAMIIGLFIQTTNPNTFVKEDYRGVINYIISKANKNDIVAISTPFIIYPFDYYYNGSSKLTTIPEWNRKTTIPKFSEDGLNTQLTTLSKDYTNLYLVLSYDQGYEKNVKSIIDSRLTEVDQKKFPPNIKLIVYKFKK